MTPTPTLYRWALIDKAGKTRMTCEAFVDPSGARAAFESKRGNKKIPKGWRVVNRGPVPTAPLKEFVPTPELPSPRVACGECEGGWLEESKTQPGVWGCLKCGRIAPRPFQIGDRVKGKTGNTGPVMNGIVEKIKEDGKVLFDVGDGGCLRWAKPENLTLLNAAEPESKLLEEAHAALKAANERVMELETEVGWMREQKAESEKWQGESNLKIEDLERLVAQAMDARKMHREALGLSVSEDPRDNGGTILDAILRLKSERETIIAQKDALIEQLRENLRETSEKLTRAFKDRDAAHIQAINATNELKSIATRMESDELAQRLGNAFYQGACMGLEIAAPKA